MKVGICGTHATGKTTLMEALKKDYSKFNMVTEAARDCPYPLNESTDFRSQEWIFRAQVQRELASPLNDITISDRTVYDQLAYTWYAMEHGNIPFEKFELLEKYISYWGFTYDYIIYIPIEFPLEEDGVRSPDENYRIDIDNKIKAILEDYVDEGRRTTVTGSVEERATKVKEIIFGLVDKYPELVK